MRGLHLFVLVALIVAAASPHPAVGQIFWIDEASQSIVRAEFDGTGVATVASGLGQPQGVALDRKGDSVYWTDPETDFRHVSRADLDGNNPEEILFAFGPIGIKVDADAGKIYWADLVLDRVSRSNLDGSFIEILLSGESASGLAIDPAAGKLFFSDPVNSKIISADLDGSNRQELVSTTQRPAGLAVDPEEGHVYWAEIGSSGSIRRANYDGSAAQAVVTGLNDPRDVAIDGSIGQLYWTEQGAGRISRSNLDGSGVVHVVPTAGLPSGLAVIELLIFVDGFDEGDLSSWSLVVQ